MSSEAGPPRSRDERRPSRGAGRAEAWSAAYAGLPGIPDEFVDAAGRPRAHWRVFLDSLTRIDDEQIGRRFAGADRYIRDLGISYRVRGETNERPWPLARLPLLVPKREWAEIAAGVAQRAEVMERVLSDVYGPGVLVGEGILPAAAVTGSPDHLRQLQGVRPPGGRWLRFYACDIGRGPDGRWWVLGDRAQSPSGAGYALENRLVLSRAFPNTYRDMNVERLAPFFREFRRGLADATPRPDPRICLLTPGPYSETYSEQAYLARYLGILLVEGGDLTVQDGVLHLRTIAGLKRADVVWRRVDADWCDPLEANASSRLGVPGLFQALRDGSVTVANMPGSGLVESRALLGFMPGLCRRLLGEDLRLPNIATWWCGQPAESALVLERLDELVVSGAFGDDAPGLGSRPNLIGAELDAAGRAAIVGELGRRGIDYVGQEVVRLSTTPVWEGGRLTPRPFVLRVYAAATEHGWEVMPGGFCRISDRGDARAVSMGEGTQSADVWVLADEPVEMSTLLPTSDNVRVRRRLGNLPSRAADNLFWMGRYLERTEATLRVVRSLCSRVVDPDSGGGRQSITRLARLLTVWGAAPADSTETSTAELATTAVHDRSRVGSAAAVAAAAKLAAGVIRERLSPDTWRLLGDLESRLANTDGLFPAEAEIHERAQDALRLTAALSGLFQENTSRVAGWRFLDLGRRIERAVNGCRFARTFADRDATADTLDVLLDLIDSQITYRSRYLVGAALVPVRDMVLLDPYNPRSVAFQTERINEHFAALPVLQEDGIPEIPHRMATRIAADLAVEDAQRVDAQKVATIERRLLSLADAIARRYFLQEPGDNRPQEDLDFA